jgi:hypothetical protein
VSSEGQDKPPDPTDTPYNRETLAAREEVEHRAFEQYVFALIKGWSEAGRQLRQKHGMDNQMPGEIREVKLEGEYPDTAIKIRVYRRSLDTESWDSYAIWKGPYFFDQKTGDRLPNIERTCGDILMWASGG